MPEIQLVTKDNCNELVQLRVRENQKHVVGSNVNSIAEAQFGYDDPDGSHWDLNPCGIYNDEGAPVGFLMYGYDFMHPKLEAFIFRLMVDQSQQGKGYGHFGMNWMLERFRSDERIENVGISYKPDNEVGRKLYANLGFVETAEMIGNEVLAVLPLR